MSELPSKAGDAESRCYSLRPSHLELEYTGTLLVETNIPELDVIFWTLHLEHFVFLNLLILLCNYLFLTDLDTTNELLSHCLWHRFTFRDINLLHFKRGYFKPSVLPSMYTFAQYARIELIIIDLYLIYNQLY